MVATTMSPHSESPTVCWGLGSHGSDPLPKPLGSLGISPRAQKIACPWMRISQTESKRTQGALQAPLRVSTGVTGSSGAGSH